ncbi:hypothetical protein [Rothia sp. ZJ932]|uniref:hypothetical protein n=1 Tax=Rothia sp. ZJ932 TaxID=2810516 RepID=UPI00196851F3|nr:hypothetical protein [Rothia sp. ZJ932]QRZ61826.1 hypothetical protein JR346_01395 [Rothia sp. ZJ932]
MSSAPQYPLPPEGFEQNQQFSEGADASAQGRFVVPRTVRAAFTAICVLGVLYGAQQIYGVILSSNLPSTREASETLGSGFTTATNIAAALFSLGFVILFFVVAWFVKAGAQWARIVAIVLSSLSLVSAVVGLLLMPLLNSLMESVASQVDVQDFREVQTLISDPLAIGMSIVAAVLYVFVIVTLSLRPSSQYYRAMREQKMMKLRLAHQTMYNAVYNPPAGSSGQPVPPRDFVQGYAPAANQGSTASQQSWQTSHSEPHSSQGAVPQAPTQRPDQSPQNQGNYRAPGDSAF